jgi:AcrR family transcriptional regulator
VTRIDKQQTKLWKRILTSNTGEVPRPRHDHGQADVRQDDQNGRALRESKEKDTSKLIVDAAERLFRQIGFQKTTVADIARELHMSPANVYRYFAAKSEINEAVCMDLLGKIEAERTKLRRPTAPLHKEYAT